MKIGIIAEEDNDADVIIEITSKLIAPSAFSSNRFVGHGCGKLRKKCSAWAKNLASRGCELLVVVHDLDRNAEKKIRKDLEAAIDGLEYKGKLVLIPVQELEAWLLSDAAAIRLCFTLNKTPKTPANPELVPSPKEHLRDLVWRVGRKRYVNTIHNKKIASLIRPKEIEKCPSYSPYPEFLAEHFLHNSG